MKNLITGTSTEVTWPQTAQVGAVSFLLSIQGQAEISPSSYQQSANIQLLSKAAIQRSPLGSPTCSDAGSLTFPKPWT